MKQLKINVRYRGHSLAVEVREGMLTVASMGARTQAICIGCGQERRELRPGESLRFDIG